MSPPPEHLPGPLRAATMAALVLSSLVAFGAVRDLPMALNAATLEMPDIELGPLKSLVKNERVYLDAMRASFRAQMTALEGMQAVRVVILTCLSTSAALVLVSALRLRWPAGARRSAIARLLTGASLATAVLRTLDGAQLLVVVRKGVAASEKVLQRSGIPEMQAPEGVNVAVSSALSVATTLATVAAFLVLSSYFRSDKARGVFTALDRDVEGEDGD